MKKNIGFLVLVLALLSGRTAYAAEVGTIGAASVECTNVALKWTVLGVTATLMGTVFGLIYKMASSDPSLFSHDHAHNG